jgi:CPA2 family monovalent cation:H+ antiporter-2
MLVGVLISSGGLALIRSQSHEVTQLAEAGVFLLLFAIGLEFSLDELLRLGRHLLVGGSLQMALVAAPVAGALIATGQDWQSATLLAAAVAFSSTVLVFKTLAEWGQTSTPGGRRAIGILLFQDVALVPLLLVVPLMTGGEAPTTREYLMLALTTVGFVVSVATLRRLLSKWLVPHLLSHRSPELVVLGAVVVLGGVTFATHRIGLPPALGAFAAGLMLSGNRWSAQFDTLVMPFRETFSVVFFVSLGLLLDLRVVMADPLRLVALLAVLILVKTIAAVVALLLTRLPWRDSLSIGIGLAHIGEFAFVLVGMAAQANLLSPETVQQFIAVALASLMLSPVLLRFGLKRIVPTVTSPDAGENRSRLRNASMETVLPSYAVVIGIGPIGARIASHLENTGHEVCVVDHSPLNLQPFEQHGFHSVAGDATDDETLDRSRISQAALAVVCVPDDSASIEIVQDIRRMNPACRIVVRCRYRSNETRLRHEGAAHVVSEEQQSGEALLRALST